MRRIDRTLRCPTAFVDFTSTDPLDVVARKVSNALFGGTPFTGENEGVWDEVPALRLSQNILGCSVELGGQPGLAGYTLQILADDFPWEKIAPDAESATHADLSGYVAEILASLPGITLTENG